MLVRQTSTPRFFADVNSKKYPAYSSIAVFAENINYQIKPAYLRNAVFPFNVNYLRKKRPLTGQVRCLQKAGPLADADDDEEAGGQSAAAPAPEVVSEAAPLHPLKSKYKHKKMLPHAKKPVAPFAAGESEVWPTPSICASSSTSRRNVLLWLSLLYLLLHPYFVHIYNDGGFSPSLIIFCTYLQ